MVKKTVNRDAQEMYHLFYDDREGSPGTSITFSSDGPEKRKGRRRNDTSTRPQNTLGRVREDMAELSCSAEGLLAGMSRSSVVT